MLASERATFKLMLRRREAREELEAWLRRMKRRREVKFRQWDTGASTKAKDEALRIDEPVQHVEGPGQERLHKVAVLVEVNVDPSQAAGMRELEMEVRRSQESVARRLEFMGFHVVRLRGLDVLEAYRLFHLP